MPEKILERERIPDEAAKIYQIKEEKWAQTRNCKGVKNSI